MEYTTAGSSFGNLMYGISDVLVVPGAVPEPSGMLLLGTGLTVVLAYGWTRRRR